MGAKAEKEIQMNLEDDLQKFILYDRKLIFKRLKVLSKNLGIETKINQMVNFINELDSIFLRNLDIEKSTNDIKKQLIYNADKRLELRCIVKGVKIYLKGFGLIKNIDEEKLKQLFEFLFLVRLSKKISDVSYYSSQHYRLDKSIEEILT
jgi:hypothetical protein